VGSKFYKPTGAKDLLPVIQKDGPKPAYLSNIYYKEESKFINYANFNEQS
jgi:hypothetical protein